MTWHSSALGDLFTLKYGKALPERSRVSDGTVPVFGSNGVVGRHDKAITAGPTVVVGRKGSAGRVAFSDRPCWPIDTTYFVDDFGDAHDPKFWAYQFKSLRLEEFEKSSAIPGLNRDDAYTRECAYPNFSEQQRIAKRLDQIAAHLDDTRARLETIPTILKRFRMSVLAAACSGRLTEDWRGNEYDNKENAELLTTAPSSWSWSYVSAVCEQIVDCPHSTPKWTETGKLCVRTSNFRPGLLDLSEHRYVSEETFTERISRLKPEPGDILYSREGSILGIACSIPNGIELCLGQRMMLLRSGEKLRAEYLMHWLNSPPILGWVRDRTGGSASPHLNVKDIKNLPVPVPPLDEQDEILHKVETLLQQAKNIDARYRKAKSFTDKLMPSVLAKAFRGELA